MALTTNATSNPYSIELPALIIHDAALAAIPTTHLLNNLLLPIIISFPTDDKRI